MFRFRLHILFKPISIIISFLLQKKYLYKTQIEFRENNLLSHNQMISQFDNL